MQRGAKKYLVVGREVVISSLGTRVVGELSPYLGSLIKYVRMPYRYSGRDYGNKFIAKLTRNLPM